ncbi:MAG: hypothetical protein J0H40_17095 [Rhizobiales bacterium]|nr:hypothetical protein [Hyphomicrobiales bacterium]
MTHRKKSLPKPDCNGLFDSAGVIHIAGRRECTVTIQSDLMLVVTAKASIPIMATQPGKWDPVSILRSCTRAQRRKAYNVDQTTANITNPYCIDEILIARIIGANGVRPYLFPPETHMVVQRRRSRDATKFLSQWWDLRLPHEKKGKWTFGKHTWTFMQLLRSPGLDAMKKYDVRRSLQALKDVGILHIELGSRGFSNAKLKWTERAYLPPTLNLYEQDALADLAAGRY